MCYLCISKDDNDWGQLFSRTVLNLCLYVNKLCADVHHCIFYFLSIAIWRVKIQQAVPLGLSLGFRQKMNGIWWQICNRAAHGAVVGRVLHDELDCNSLSQRRVHGFNAEIRPLVLILTKKSPTCNVIFANVSVSSSPYERHEDDRTENLVFRCKLEKATSVNIRTTQECSVLCSVAPSTPSQHTTHPRPGVYSLRDIPLPCAIPNSSNNKGTLGASVAYQHTTLHHTCIICYWFARHSPKIHSLFSALNTTTTLETRAPLVCQSLRLSSASRQARSAAHPQHHHDVQCTHATSRLAGHGEEHLRHLRLRIKRRPAARSVPRRIDTGAWPRRTFRTVARGHSESFPPAEGQRHRQKKNHATRRAFHSAWYISWAYGREII